MNRRILTLLAMLAVVLPLGQSWAVTQVIGTPNPTANVSGSITTGGTFQQVAAASNDRKSFEFYNNNAAHTCYIYFGTTAKANSDGTTKALPVIAGGYYLRADGSFGNDAIQVTCSNTSDTFYAAVQ